MPDLHAAIDRLSDDDAALFAQVRDATRDDVGVTRDAFGAKETIAGELLIRFEYRPDPEKQRRWAHA